MTTIDPPRAIRVKTTTGWADLAIKGADGTDGKDGSTFNYVGAYVPGNTYNNGQTVVGPDGITYVCILDGTTTAPAPWATAWAGVPQPVVNGQWIKGVGGAATWAPITPADVAPIPYSGSLPASPYDGMETILTDGVNYQWRLRYNAGSGSAYKWEFIGGYPYTVYNGLGGLISSGYPVAPPNWYSPFAGANFTVPRAGDYTITGGFIAVTANGAQTAYVLSTVFRNAGPGAINWNEGLTPQGVTSNGSLTIGVPVTPIAGCAVGDVIGVACATSANGTIQWSSCGYQVIPRRLA